MNRTSIGISAGITVLMFLGVLGYVSAQQDDGDSVPDNEPPVMTAERLGELIRSVDGDATQSGPAWYFKVAELDTVVVYDVSADRMRIVIPIGPVEDMPEGELMRLMQANFDSALDARYAIAEGTVWGVFIHPLSTLTDDDFLAGLGQTANVVATYGSSYSSGLLIFGTGDSAEIQRRQLIDELKKKKI